MRRRTAIKSGLALTTLTFLGAPFKVLELQLILNQTSYLMIHQSGSILA